MSFTQWFQRKKDQLKSCWKSGRIQRSSRIVYDVFWNIILFFLIIGIISLFFAGGVGAGYFASLVKDENIQSAEHMEKAIYNYEETSKLFFADGIYLGDVRADLHREEVSLKDVSETLINAVIATEDEYFHEHKGVVPKAIMRAILQEATNAEIKTGGSTLTQQLIKNQILTNEVSFDRKAKEILLAMRLERFFEKDEILEAYLNIIPYGREASGKNIAGIQTAAQGIFGINADEVNLPQAAYLAGLPQSPSVYTPFLNTGGLKSEEGLQPGLNRMKTVLKRMYDLQYISKKEYDEALSYDLVADFIEEKSTTNEKYGYLTDEIQERAQDIILKILIEEDGYTMDDLENDDVLREQYEILASRELRTGGYNIHSTIDKNIYDAMQKVASEYKHYGPDRKILIKNEETGETIEKIEPVQVGAMLIENHTGRIISFVGGREYSLDNEWNYATKAERPNGSTMKPLIDYAPAMELGIVQPGTPIADYKRSYPVPGQPPYEPRNYGGGYYGIVSAREALAKSHNIPAVDIYSKIIDEDPAKNYLEKMGFTSLTEGDHANLSLALGAMNRGVTVEENTNAFATFGNNGNFVDAFMIEKIVTNDGEIIYEHESESVEIFSPQTNYLTVDMMRDVIRSGTATYMNSQIKHGNVDWVGKTGTSNNYEDAWFVGVNPNVTFGLWIGYDTPHDLMNSCRGCSLSYSQRANKLWAELINTAADINPDLIAPSERFKRPDGIVEKSICAISGMLPSDLCKKVGLVRTDLFNEKFVPTKVDDSLVEGSYVLIDGKAVIAGSETPEDFIRGDGVTFNPEFLKRNGYDKLDDLTKLFPRTNRHLWEKIGIPNTDLGEKIEYDSKVPAPPTSLKVSKNKLTWKKSSSKDVVGYHIYYASNPDDDYELIGSTTDTEVKFSGNHAILHVKAVNYFGLESKASNEITIGQPFTSDKSDEDQDDHEQSDIKEQKREKNREEKVKDKNNKQNEDQKELEKNEDNEEA